MTIDRLHDFEVIQLFIEGSGSKSPLVWIGLIRIVYFKRHTQRSRIAQQHFIFQKNELPINTLPILELVSAVLLYMLVATHLYVAWSGGWKLSITSRLLTSSVVKFEVKLPTGMTLLSLYQIILGRGEPLEEQLSRIFSLIAGTVM